MEGDSGTAMIAGNVPDSLYGTGDSDDTVVGTTVRTKPQAGYRYIERDEIVVLEDLDTFDRCFLWQFCQIVGCFHSCSKPPLEMKIILLQTNHNTGSLEQLWKHLT